MLLQQINIKNFRNFSEGRFNFNPFITIIIGENARGKSNLLEAIYFLINGWGFRETKGEELIKLGENKAVVEGNFFISDKNFHFRINLDKKQLETEKVFFINSTKKKHSGYIKEQTKAVLFSPQYLEIIFGAPEKRRDYFNKLISSHDFDYKKKLINYENALRRRNKILENFRSEIELKEELQFWNRYLEEQAIYIINKRQHYVDYLNINQKLDNKIFSVDYLKNEVTKDKFREMFNEEKRFRKTLIGPQKDDFQILLNNKIKKNIHRFGSRSDQRLAVFWLKLNEIRYYEDNFNKKPIILLDDIFSELDFHNKKIVLNLIKKYQTVVTTTEIELLDMIDGPRSIIKL